MFPTAVEGVQQEQDRPLTAAFLLLNNEFGTAKALICDYINATIGLEALAHDIGA